MPSLAELVDAVVGIDTHRDTHEAEIADATGSPIATLTISNDDAGFASLLRWITRHAPGRRVAVSVEGTRSYGIGVARALAAAGVLVLECEQPHRAQRRGKGKSDPIDAHLAVLRYCHFPVTRSPSARVTVRRVVAGRLPAHGRCLDCDHRPGSRVLPGTRQRVQQQLPVQLAVQRTPGRDAARVRAGGRVADPQRDRGQPGRGGGDAHLSAASSERPEAVRVTCLGVPGSEGDEQPGRAPDVWNPPWHPRSVGCEGLRDGERVLVEVHANDLAVLDGQVSAYDLTCQSRYGLMCRCSAS